MSIFVALSIVFVATILMFKVATIAKNRTLVYSQPSYINFQLIYQSGLLFIALIVLMFLYFINPANFEQFLHVGNISAPAQSVYWLGIEDDETWLSLGASLSFFITTITATFIYFQFKRENIAIKAILPYLPWVVLFSITNSFSEEVIYRLGIIIPLYGEIDTSMVLLISAITFGLPHFRGMPSGVIGVLMATLLGWLLAKSVVETQGIFWAWSIHFLQDVVIISALLLSAMHQEKSSKHARQEPYM